MTNELFNKILRDEGLEDWTYKFNTGGGLCLRNHKQIWLGKEENSLTLFLHEVAHALTTDDKIPEIFRGSDSTGHHVIWGCKFHNLVEKYMKEK
jgi:hypothetical protein